MGTDILPEIRLSPRTLPQGQRVLMELIVRNSANQHWRHVRGRVRGDETLLLLSESRFHFPQLRAGHSERWFFRVKGAQHGDHNLYIDHLSFQIGGRLHRCPPVVKTIQVQPKDKKGFVVQALCLPRWLRADVWSPLQFWLFNTGEETLSLRAPSIRMRGGKVRTTLSPGHEKLPDLLPDQALVVEVLSFSNNRCDRSRVSSLAYPFGILAVLAFCITPSDFGRREAVPQNSKQPVYYKYLDWRCG